MNVPYERTAAWLSQRVWLGLATGVIVWSAWLGSLLFGGSTVKWVGFSGDSGPLTGAIALGDGESDILGQLVSVDHLAFYSPARMVLEGRQGDIYDFEKLWTYQQSLFAPGKWEAFEAYRNPPFYLLPYMLTAALPYAASAWIWSAIAILCLIVGIRWLNAECPWRVTMWSLTFLPVFATVSYGQNTLLSFAAFCGTYQLLAVKRPFAAGLVAGLLWFKPPLLLGLFVWWTLDIRRYWASWLGVFVTGTVLTAISYVFLPEAWSGFVGSLKTNLEFASFDWWKAHNARAFWRQLLPPEAGVSIGEHRLSLAVILWAICGLAGLALFVRIWWARRDDLPVVFAASVLLMLWATPHAMIYEWALALVPAVLLWERYPRYRPTFLVLNSIMWVALFVSTEVGHGQFLLQRDWLHLQQMYVVQVSVPIFAWACWKGTRLILADNGELTSTPPAVVPDEAVGSHGTDRRSDAPVPGSTP